MDRRVARSAWGIVFIGGLTLISAALQHWQTRILRECWIRQRALALIKVATSVGCYGLPEAAIGA